MKKFKLYFQSAAMWTLISAAFIGPGTVITALNAGQAFGTQLTWALVFAILACIILQEAVARITIVTGKNLIEVLRQRYNRSPSVPIAAAFIVFFGCMAYQAGNVTGAAIPLLELTELTIGAIALAISLIAGAVLYSGKIKSIAAILGSVVAMMGIGFIYISITGSRQYSQIPIWPDSNTSLMLILALIGTTIVPYNLFLGSRVAKEQTDIQIMRVGITVSVIIGGVISMAIMISGTLLPQDLTPMEFYGFFKEKYGVLPAMLFAVGLFGAGFTSAVTSPLAASVTIQSAFPERQRAFNISWLMVMVVGALFATVGGSPAFVIIFAQAINGFFLPAIVWIIALIINDISIMPQRNGQVSNVLLIIIFFTTCNLGLLNLLKAGGKAFNLVLPDDALTLTVAVAAALSSYLGYKMLRKS